MFGVERERGERELSDRGKDTFQVETHSEREMFSLFILQVGVLFIRAGAYEYTAR